MRIGQNPLIADRGAIMSLVLVFSSASPTQAHTSPVVRAFAHMLDFTGENFLAFFAAIHAYLLMCRVQLHATGKGAGRDVRPARRTGVQPHDGEQMAGT